MGAFDMGNSSTAAPIISTPYTAGLVPIPNVGGFAIVGPGTVSDGRTRVGGGDILRGVQPETLTSPVLTVPAAEMRAAGKTVVVFVDHGGVIIGVSVSYT